MQLTDVLELGTREGVRRYVEKRAGVMLPLAVGAMIPGIVHKAIDRAHSTERQLNQSEYAPMDYVPSKTASEPDRILSGATVKTPFKMEPSPGSNALTRSSPFSRMQAHGREAGKAVGSSVGGSLGDSLLGSLGALGASPVQGAASGVSGGISELIKRKLLGREFGEKKDPFHMGAGQAIQTFGKEMGTSGANLLRDIANKAMEAAGHAGDTSARAAIIGDLKRTDPVLSSADDSTLMEAYHTMTRFAPVLSTDKNAVRSFLRQAVMSGSGPDFMSIKLLADSERAVTGEKDKR